MTYSRVVGLMMTNCSGCDMQRFSISAMAVFCAASFCTPAAAQKPVVDSRGVMNAATLAPVTGPNYWGPPSGSIATIFGQNLAPTTASAAQVPLPTSLAGVSVLMTAPGLSSQGVPLPLLFVSPGQINFQIPNAPSGGLGPITIETPNGTSESVQVYFPMVAPGIFTQDGSGCGPAWVLNIAGNGSWTLNSPENSVEPGGLIAILGTGRG